MLRTTYGSICYNVYGGLGPSIFNSGSRLKNMNKFCFYIQMVVTSILENILDELLLCHHIKLRSRQHTICSFIILVIIYEDNS